MKQIDFVVTWVNGNDSEWRKEKQKYEVSDNHVNLNDDARYREMDTFHYWFRAVEKYAPWVNKIFFVTWGHIPEWLDTEHPKIKIIKHSDYIPNEYLPTFSSNVIELNLFRIAELSEHFVLFSDDVFINSPLEIDDLFKNNLPKLLGIYRPLVPSKEFNYIDFNNILVINKYFYDKVTFKQNRRKFFRAGYGKFNLYNLFNLFYTGIIGYHDAHVAMPHLKSTFQALWDKEYDLLNSLCLRKFRSTKDVNHWLMSYWNIESNLFEPQSINVGEYVPLAYTDKIESIVKSGNFKFICINDDENTIDFKREVTALHELFEGKFPQKSKFEK